MLTKIAGAVVLLLVSLPVFGQVESPRAGSGGAVDLSSPGTIGGTSPGAAHFTTLSTTGAATSTIPNQSTLPYSSTNLNGPMGNLFSLASTDAGSWSIIGTDGTATDTLEFGTGGFEFTPETGSPVTVNGDLEASGSIASTANGTNPGYLTFVGDTANPSLTADTVGLLGPTSATPDTYALQLSATAPTTGQCLVIGTVAAGVAPLNYAACSAGATTALDNLASVAINTSLISDTANTDDLGSTTVPWNETFSTLFSTGGDTGDNTVGLALKNADIINWEISPAGTDISISVASNEVMTISGTVGLVISGSAGISATGANSSLAGVTATSVRIPNLLIATTAPTISSGFGTTPSITTNGTSSFAITIGTGGTESSGVIALTAATTGWTCWANDVTATTANTGYNTVQLASTTTSATLENQTTSTGAAVAWGAGDVIRVSCFGY